MAPARLAQDLHSGVMLPFAAGLVEVGELVGLQRPGLGRRRAGVRFVAGEVRGGCREVPVAERRAVAADAVVQFQPGDDRRVRRLAGTGVKAEAAFSGDGQPAFRIAEVQDVRVLPVLVEEVDAFLFGQAADEVIVRLAVLGAIFPLGVLVPKLEAVRPGTGAKKKGGRSLPFVRHVLPSVGNPLVFLCGRGRCA